MACFIANVLMLPLYVDIIHHDYVSLITHFGSNGFQLFSQNMLLC